MTTLQGIVGNIAKKKEANVLVTRIVVHQNSVEDNETDYAAKELKKIVSYNKIEAKKETKIT